MKLLIIEDEVDLNKSMTKLLKKQQFSVDSAYDGVEAFDYLAVSEYDVIIVDVMMPKMNGFEFVEELRRLGNDVPVLMLTARDSLEDKIKGLNLGADDYVVKPFEFDELLARIGAMLRRNHRDVVSQIITVGQVVIDLAKKIVEKNHVPIDLTAKEYEVLEFLVRHKNHILTREKIRHHVWDFDYEGESNIIDVIVKNIRRKLDDDGAPSIIQTKRGVGYVVPA